MTPATPMAQQGGSPAASRRPENLALVFQELLTVVVRLRSNRQPVTNAELFRGQVRGAMRQADQDAKRLGYTDEDIRYGIFAVVAFLDESILNLQNPVFQDWVRKPLQEEVFGRHTAGEIFYDHLQILLGKRDAPETADVLEIYQLCMLLGFVGKYSISGRGELKAITDAVAEKIRRIRKDRPGIALNWRLPERRAPLQIGDPWIKKLMYTTVGVCILALVLFIVYKLVLGSGLSSLRTLATPLSK